MPDNVCRGIPRIYRPKDEICCHDFFGRLTAMRLPSVQHTGRECFHGTQVMTPSTVCHRKLFSVRVSVGRASVLVTDEIFGSQGRTPWSLAVLECQEMYAKNAGA